MRRIPSWSPALLAFSLLIGDPCLSHRLAAQPALRPEPPPAPVQEVLDKYLKAVAAGDLPAMTAVADVPWLDRDRQVIHDRAELAKAVERVVTQLQADGGRREIKTYPIQKMRERIKDEAERKLLDEVLGNDGWMILVEEDGYPLSARTLLIRFRDGKAAVVAGPLKQNQLAPKNPIPDKVERLFDKAETLELYSLNPDLGPGEGGRPLTDGFHGWQVLGQTEVKEQADRKRLADALRLAAEDNFGMAAACFNPRHGLRLKQGDATIDLVICFQCLQVLVYEKDKKREAFLTTHGPQPAFDAMLTKADIPLPKQAKD